jgi:hypothetical protein
MVERAEYYEYFDVCTRRFHDPHHTIADGLWTNVVSWERSVMFQVAFRDHDGQDAGLDRKYTKLCRLRAEVIGRVKLERKRGGGNEEEETQTKMQGELDCVDSKCLEALGLVVQSLCWLDSRLELVVIMIVTICISAQCPQT